MDLTVDLRYIIVRMLICLNPHYHNVFKISDQNRTVHHHPPPKQKDKMVKYNSDYIKKNPSLNFY